MSDRFVEILIGAGLTVVAWLHWRFSLWWNMSNRYGTGKTEGRPVLPWMKFQRFAGTVGLAFFATLFIIGGATGTMTSINR